MLSDSTDARIYLKKFSFVQPVTFCQIVSDSLRFPIGRTLIDFMRFPGPVGFHNNSSELI